MLRGGGFLLPRGRFVLGSPHLVRLGALRVAAAEQRQPQEAKRRMRSSRHRMIPFTCCVQRGTGALRHDRGCVTSAVLFSLILELATRT
jgi:hypothetical protein